MLEGGKGGIPDDDVRSEVDGGEERGAYLGGSRWEDPGRVVGDPYREDPFLVEGRGAHLVDPSFREAGERVDDLWSWWDEDLAYGW